jgi:hypothetical protein
MAIPGGGGTLLNPLFQVISFGAGTAMGPVLRPTLQDLANEVWSLHTVRPLDVGQAAALWVEGSWTRDRAVEEAAKTGYSPALVEALRELADNPPDVQTMYALWRRDLISSDRFMEGLRHQRIEPAYFEALRQAHDVLLTPEELAAARVKGHVDQARQYAEAELQGVTNERAQIMYETTGNPPGPETLITLLNRGIITQAEFAQGIKQGNIRPEYVDEYLELREHLLTVTEVVNLRLRGWHDDAWMNARGAELGYTQERMHDLFLGQGRPISTRQVFIGQRRGGVYNGPTGDIDPAILKQLQESNIRPEWYDLADAQKESYPSAFVIRGLATSGAINAAQTRRVLLEIGWPEWLIDAVVTFWTGAGAGAAVAGPRVKSAQTAAITEIRNAYLLGQTDEGQARGWLGQIGVDPLEIDGMLPIWNVMREVPQRGLTPSQIKKAYKSLPTQWPRTRAIDELQQLGLTADDAATLLDE